MNTDARAVGTKSTNVSVLSYACRIFLFIPFATGEIVIYKLIWRLLALLMLSATPSAFAEKKYSPGASDTEIRIGQTMPYSGPISAYGAIGRAQMSYFDKVNAEGGINGRKVNFISLDDGYNPAKTVENTRRLVEQDEDSGLPFSLPSLLMMPAKRYPDLNIVVAHCGGGIFVHEAMLAAIFCPNIFLELSSLMPHQVLEVLTEVPANRLMIGSDLPENLSTETGKILTLEIPDQDKRQILCGTACSVFLGTVL